MERMLYRFAGFELDTAQRELRHSGQRIDLQPRVYDLLLYLLNNRERAVGKEELQDAVWSGVVVTEASLTRAVMKARKAIGDDASTQSMIRTVHGHGYHFVAPVELAKPQAATSQAPSSAIQKTPPWFLPAMVAVVVLLAVAGIWKTFKPIPEPAEMRVAVLPLSDRTEVPDLAWAPLGLMSLATEMLGAEGTLPVVDDSNVVGLAAASDWDGDPESLASSELFRLLQQVYGATHVVAMELVSEGPMLRMNYSMLDRHGRSQRSTMVGQDPVQLTQGVVQGVHGLLLGRSQLVEHTELVSEDPFNNEAFARGMDLSLEGRCAEAVQFFRLIVEQEPGLFAPRFELASCLRILGEPNEAEEILHSLVAEQEQLGQTAGVARALTLLAVLQNRTGRLDEAEASYRLALEAAQAAAAPDLVARVLHNRAILSKNRGKWAESAEDLDRAATWYQRAGREIMPGQLWSGYANLEMEQGRLAEADEYLQKALQAFRAVNDRRSEAMMLNNYGYLRRMQGRLDEAEAFHMESLAIREDIRDRVGVGRNYGMLSGLYTARGDYELAREAANQALGIARETKDSLFEGTSLAQLANAERRLGLTAEARAHYLESRDVLLSIQDSMRVLQVELKLAQMEMTAGFPEKAEPVLREALTRAREGNYVQPEVEATVLLGELAQSSGDEATAIDRYTEALERVRAADLPMWERSVLLHLADLRMDRGELDDAAPLLGAVALLESTPSSLKALARYAWMTGDAVLAIRHMETARDLAGDNWSTDDAALLDAYLAR